MTFFDGFGENELKSMARERKDNASIDFGNDPHSKLNLVQRVKNKQLN